MTRDEASPNDTVGRGCECPTCGECRIDELYLDDDDRVTCHCGTVYALDN